MGEGLREETVIEAATGGGADGDPDCSPTGEASGRFFSLQNAPVISGRTELYLNNNLLRGKEQAISATTALDEDFDYRIDITTGCIELIGASIGDQDGKSYSASTLNVGNGVIVDGTCGTSDLVAVIDENAPEERWTVRCVGVIRDSNGDPIPGQATFTLTGSISGQLVDEFGSPILFHSSYYTNTTGAASGSQDPCSDGYVVASSSVFGTGSAVAVSGDASPLTTKEFEFSGDLVTQGQALVGDELCVDGYVGIEIEDIEYDSGTDLTTLTLTTDSLDASISSVEWDIRATNLFIDDPDVVHNGLTGDPATAGSFTSGDLGKVLTICSGDTQGRYTIDQITSSRRIRVSQLSDPLLGFPSLADDNADGLSERGLTFHILETNGVLLLGIQEGSVPFEVGDKFFVDVNSKVLKENDTLEARYIAETDINDPQLFVSAAELAQKHGQQSINNTLALGSRLTFENGAPFVLALQTKPPIARRTSVTLIVEEDANGDGGFTACGGDHLDCEPDDLIFPIPLPFEGLGKGRPDGDTQVNIFVVRNEEESQIFPNKVTFYNSQYENSTGQNAFISSPDTTYSYTIINTDTAVAGQGYNGALVAADQSFSTVEVDFDAEDVGRVIVVQSLETDATPPAVRTTSDDISTYLFGDTTTGVELVITAIVDDNTVTVAGNIVGTPAFLNDANDIQFYVKDIEDTTDKRAALMIHRDLVNSGTLQVGDGIRISYIDETDADFFDTNWFEAFEALEAEDCQMVIPLPLQNRSGIFRAAVGHVETMSTIAIQKERVTFFGAQQGVTVDALLGLEEVAVEDIGVLEGIQGDEPEEVLDGNTEDLVNYKLSDNFTSNRAMYFYPDQIVRDINGTNTFIDGFYMAAAAAGWFCASQNIALPLTNKTLQGFSILRDKKYRPVIRNLIGAEGATLLEPVIGGGRVLAGRTTSQSGFVEDEEISIIFIRDRVKQVLRDGLRTFIGRAEDPNTPAVITSRVVQLLSALLSQNIITAFENVRVERDKVEPRQWNVFLRFQPTYPINYIFIDIEVGVL
jgi:hypothetical protein